MYFIINCFFILFSVQDAEENVDIFSAKEELYKHTGFDIWPILLGSAQGKGFGAIVGQKESEQEERRILSNEFDFTCRQVNNYMNNTTKYNDIIYRRMKDSFIEKYMEWRKQQYRELVPKYLIYIKELKQKVPLLLAIPNNNIG